MHIALGSDHAGHELRQAVHVHLERLGHTVLDVGTFTAESVDYPLFAAQVCRKVATHEATLGILVCGTGIGMSLAANRVRGVRAALCTESYTAKLARAHNDANVLCMGQRVVGEGVALNMVDTFITTEFEGGRHARRIDQLKKLEEASEGPFAEATGQVAAPGVKAAPR